MFLSTKKLQSIIYMPLLLPVTLWDEVCSIIHCLRESYKYQIQLDILAGCWLLVSEKMKNILNFFKGLDD